MLKKAEDGVR